MNEGLSIIILLAGILVVTIMNRYKFQAAEKELILQRTVQ